MKKIVMTIVFIVASTFIIINIFSAMNLSFFGIRFFRIVSGSMEPHLKINDLIVIKAYSNYNVGDIITFKDTEHNYVTHRIIKINDDNTIITKGDNNNAEDDFITQNEITGKLIYKLAILTFFSKLILQPFFLISTFIIGVFIIIIMPNRREKGKHIK